MQAIQELLKIAVIVYLIGLQLVIILLLVKPQIAQTINYKFGVGPKPKYYDFALSKQLLNDHRVPQGAIIFIGDNITENLDVSVISPKAVNLGISKDTTVGVLKRVPLYDSLTR